MWYYIIGRFNLLIDFQYNPPKCLYNNNNNNNTQNKTPYWHLSERFRNLLAVGKSSLQILSWFNFSYFCSSLIPFILLYITYLLTVSSLKLCLFCHCCRFLFGFFLHLMIEILYSLQFWDFIILSINSICAMFATFSPSFFPHVF